MRQAHLSAALALALLATASGCGAEHHRAAPRRALPARPGGDPGARPEADATASPSAGASVRGEPPARGSPTEAPADAGTAPPAAPATPAAACPADMVLVEGSYCPRVEQRCVRHRYTAGRRKKICLEFEPPTRCVGREEPRRYCVDRYAWPSRAGARPEVMNTFHQAQVKCAAVGKRMCTESEWTLACEGPERKPFPHGWVRDAARCNGDHPWDFPDLRKVSRRDPAELARLWRGVPSGSQPGCVSDYGVHDLPGNVDEVVASERLPGAEFPFDSVHTGGPWYDTAMNQCRPKIYTHDEDFYYYFLGFRCCAEPDGAVTDPRTPRQRARRQRFEVVERRAGVGVAEAREAIERARRGECTCAPGDVRCGTLCGSLLGPGARDADPAAPRGPNGPGHLGPAAPTR